MQLHNRVVMAPMTRSKCLGHIPSAAVAGYYRRRAEGEVALIITEGTVIEHKAGHGYPDVPSFYGKQALEGWRYVVEQVHEAGAKIFPQLWHVGSVRQRHQCLNEGVDNPKKQCSDEGRIPGFGPSPISHPYVKNGEVPHIMTKEDIQEVVQAFAEGAVNAKLLGFDGVEIHGAHGYLIDQFFWDHTNQRHDEYGGKTVAARTRFAVEIIKAVRAAVGPEFPIDFRFSQWKLGAYEAKLAATPEELRSFLEPLVEAGVDIFHCSTRRFWEAEFPESSLNLAGWTKKITGKPTITVGSIGLDNDFVSTMQGTSTPHPSKEHMQWLHESLDRGDFDLAAIGRALLADPFWLQKTRSGRRDEIKPFTQECLQTLS